MYHLRITMTKCITPYVSESVFQRVVENFLDQQARLWVCGLEAPPVDKQAHVHCHLEDTRLKLPSLRIALKRMFGPGNGVFSISKVKTSQVQNIAYVIKRHNYTNSPNVSKDLLAEAEELCRNFKVEQEKHKKAKPTSTIKALRAICEEKQPSNVSMVIDIVYGYYVEHQVMIREFQMISQIQTLSAQFVPVFGPAFKRLLNDRMNTIIDNGAFNRDRPPMYPLSIHVGPDIVPHTIGKDVLYWGPLDSPNQNE